MSFIKEKVWHVVFFFSFLSTFLYILINMSPFWYDRYFYRHPVRGVLTWCGRVIEATSERYCTQTDGRGVNRRGCFGTTAVGEMIARWCWCWTVHLNCIQSFSEKTQLPVGPLEPAPLWAMDAAFAKFSPSFTFSTSLKKNKQTERSNTYQGGAMTDSPNAHGNTSGNMRASY